MSYVIFIKHFKSSKRYYVFDVKTNHIIEAPPLVYLISGDWNAAGGRSIDYSKYRVRYTVKEIKNAVRMIRSARKNDFDK